MAAVARGEPDPGPKLPDPARDLRDLWGTDAAVEMLAELEKVIDEEIDKEIKSVAADPAWGT
ncbi:MAG TPA: hypothetical protein VFH61_07375 [Thermoleophilia bacterium]|nr:hypothetical protein [Thermoleophilia bacterium]